MKLIWTRHAIQRGYKRLGRYGMDTLESKILKNINRAKPNKETTLRANVNPFYTGLMYRREL